MRRLINWFERYLGWFFINGNKQEQWGKYIFDKYEKDSSNNKRTL
jgi:hypothetical protein